MKKLLLGISLLGVLATQSFSKDYEFKENSNKNEICKEMNNLGSLLYYEFPVEKRHTMRYLGSLSGNAESLSRIYGEISTDLLKDLGIGVSVNMNWNTFVMSYAKFTTSLTDDEKEEFVKFYYSLHKEVMNINKKQTIKKILLANTDIYMKYNFKIDEMLLIDEFIFPKNKSVDSKRFGEFFKYMMLKDVSRAKAYIKQSNIETNIDTYIEEIKNSCDSKDTKTLLDVYTHDIK